MGIIASMTALFGCTEIQTGEKGSSGIGNKAVSNESGIVTLNYSYIGSVGGGSYTYDISKDGDRYYFTFEGMDYHDYPEMRAELAEGDLEKINQLYLDMHIAAWDGFDKTNTMVCDGSGFSFSLTFEDGKHLNAQGTNAFPDGYREFTDALEKLLLPYKERVTEDGRQYIIEKGISGELTSVFVNIVQHGNSGRDSYAICLYDSGIRQNNFDVTIDSDSCEFFEKGKSVYYTTLPDEALCFDKIKTLIEKYDLIKWYDYHENADDYGNAEWFQISMSFEDGEISAYGTLHPDNYDEFRTDFLKLIAEVIEDAKNNYGLTVYEK